jgi:hypothetical protein
VSSFTNCLAVQLPHHHDRRGVERLFAAGDVAGGRDVLASLPERDQAGVVDEDLLSLLQVLDDLAAIVLGARLGQRFAGDRG